MVFKETRLARRMLLLLHAAGLYVLSKGHIYIYIQTYDEEMYILTYVWFPDEQFSNKMRSKVICFFLEKNK